MWIDEYIALMSKDPISLNDINRAMEIKDANLPSKIYRGRPCNKYTKDREKDNFRNDTVWLCSAAKYNDPYECCTTIDFEVILRTIHEKHFNEIISRFNIQSRPTQDEISEIRKADDLMRALAYALLRKDANIPLEKHDDMVEELFAVRNEVSSDTYQCFNNFVPLMWVFR